MNEQQILGIVFDQMCAANNKIIDSGEKVTPVVIFLTEDILKGIPPQARMLEMNNQEDKEKLQIEIKNAAIKKKGIWGYILIVDSSATMIDTKMNVKSKQDCIMRTIYSPTYKATNMQFYDKNGMTTNKIIVGRSNVFDPWDAWNQGDLNKLLKSE